MKTAEMRRKMKSLLESNMCSRETSLMKLKALVKDYESLVCSVTVIFGYGAWASTREFGLNVFACCPLVSASFGKSPLDLFAYLYHIVWRPGFTVHKWAWISIRIAWNLMCNLYGFAIPIP